MKRVVQIYESFEGAEQAERDYYMGLTPEERLDILFELRARHEATFGPKETSTEAGSERRHARVCRVAQRSRR